MDDDDPLAAYAQQLRDKHGKHGFTVVVQPPFVVLGDEAAHTVQRRSEGTVAWAVSRLKEAYFDADPNEQITIWLFAGEKSYRKWALKLFGDRPDTPFGYYTGEHNALVMNIATGGGTLVHEIVHPFIDANFPKCPAWFDEGLASLYEQCGEEDGRIKGFTNWRLEGLQQAIRADQVPSFKTLCSTTRTQFYDEDPGTNYAQARYLCYFLQEQGALREYYKAFAGGVDADPSGYGTLKDVVGYRDMNKFKRDWEKFTLGLAF